MTDQCSNNGQEVSLVFWWTFPCRAMIPVFREVANIEGNRVSIVVERGTSPARKKLGWGIPDSGKADLKVLSDDAWKAEVDRILEDTKDSIHLFGGYQRRERLRYALNAAQKKGLRNGAMIEAPLNMFHGFKKRAKDFYLKHIIPIRGRKIASKSACILCLSGRRFKELADLGWDEHKVFPFGYFMDERGSISRDTIGEGDTVNLLSTGHLVRFKGTDILLRALALLKERGVAYQCNITGEGSEQSRLLAMQKELGLTDSVHFLGLIDDDQVTDLLARSDIFVASGYAEPWAIRINEGLQTSMAVVASDRLGACELIAASGAGMVFRSGDAGDLCECLSQLITSLSRLAEAKARARRYKDSITPSAAAKYLSDVLQFVFHDRGERPVPPWHVPMSLEG